MAEADEEGRLTRAYGFNPHTQQARTNEEDEDAEEGSLWSTDPIWQADLAAGQSLKEASYHYLVTDHLGTPVLALNKAGEATWKANYEAFGKARINPASTAQINLRLPGQYFDAETGLHQNWNRDYAPGIGRYVQADPLGIFGGMNVYQYAYGNPMVYMDPEGNYVWFPAGAIIGGVIGGLGAAWDVYNSHGEYGFWGGMGKIIWGATSGALSGGILEPTKLWTFGMLVADSIVTQTLKDKCISLTRTLYDVGVSGSIGFVTGEFANWRFNRIVDGKIAKRGKVILGDGIAAAKSVASEGSIISYGLSKIPDVEIISSFADYWVNRGDEFIFNRTGINCGC